MAPGQQVWPQGSRGSGPSLKGPGSPPGPVRHLLSLRDQPCRPAPVSPGARPWDTSHLVCPPSLLPTGTQVTALTFILSSPPPPSSLEAHTPSGLAPLLSTVPRPHRQHFQPGQGLSPLQLDSWPGRSGWPSSSPPSPGSLPGLLRALPVVFALRDHLTCASGGPAGSPNLMTPTTQDHLFRAAYLRLPKIHTKVETVGPSGGLSGPRRGDAGTALPLPPGRGGALPRAGPADLTQTPAAWAWSRQARSAQQPDLDTLPRMPSPPPPRRPILPPPVFPTLLPSPPPSHPSPLPVLLPRPR